jgi:D-alanine--poly(phosphoribitol) ligase subunit 2
MTDTQMERLHEILESIRPDIDFKNEKELMDGGFLDSFDIVSIISELDNEYGVNVRVTELKPENFNSAEAIMNMVRRLQNQ